MEQENNDYKKKVKEDKNSYWEKKYKADNDKDNGEKEHAGEQQ